MKTDTISDIAYIEREKFLELLSDYSLDFEKFNMIKDNIQIYRRTEQLKQSCYSCGSFKHFLQRCPQITPTIDSDLIIRRFDNAQRRLYRVTQMERREFRRT